MLCKGIDSVQEGLHYNIAKTRNLLICGVGVVILPVFGSCVRWLLCVLWNPPDRANADSAGDTPLAAQNLNAAGGDTPAFGGLCDG